MNRAWRIGGVALPGISLAVLVTLRVYAALLSVQVVTWDDVQIRQDAAVEARSISVAGAVAQIIFPNVRVIGHRSSGYHYWLVLSRRLFLGSPGERCFQLLNVLFWGLQGLWAFLLTIPRQSRGDSIA